MRVVIAMMKHETNTFSPVPTPIERFARGFPMPPRGKDAYNAFKGTGSAMGAFIDIAEREGWDIVTPIAAQASPSAPVQDAAYKEITDAICDAVAEGCDAIMLDLHGAMVTETHVVGVLHFVVVVALEKSGRRKVENEQRQTSK